MTCMCVSVDTNVDKPLDGLLRFVAAVIPEIPYEVAIEYLRQSYTEFARYSSLLGYTQEIVLQKDVKEYTLEPPEGYCILGVVKQENTGGFLPNAHRWFYFYGERFRMLGNDRILLETAPSQDGKKLCIELHLLPIECVSTIPEDIAIPYGYGIAQGAVAELLLMPGKSWTNARAGAEYRRRFVTTLQAGRNLFLTDRGVKRVMMDRVRVI